MTEQNMAIIKYMLFYFQKKRRKSSYSVNPMEGSNSFRRTEFRCSDLMGERADKNGDLHLELNLNKVKLIGNSVTLPSPCCLQHTLSVPDIDCQ